LELPDLFGSQDFTVIDLNGRILLDPLAKCRLRNAVLFAELSLRFAVLKKGYEGLFEIIIVFSVIICSYEGTSFLCLFYCNRPFTFMSTFLVYIQKANLPVLSTCP